MCSRDDDPTTIGLLEVLVERSALGLPGDRLDPDLAVGGGALGARPGASRDENQPVPETPDRVSGRSARALAAPAPVAAASPRADSHRGAPADDYDYRRDVAIEAVYKGLKQHDEAKRFAKGMRDALGGRGPRIQRGTQRGALAVRLGDAVLEALSSIEP